MKIFEFLRQRKVLIPLLALVLLVAYVWSFVSWWNSGSVQVSNANGIQVNRVELKMTSVRWRSIYLWMPAMLFMEHVVGYKLVRQVAADEDSVYVFEK